MGKRETEKSEKEGLVRYCSLSVRVQIIEREKEREREKQRAEIIFIAEEP